MKLSNMNLINYFNQLHHFSEKEKEIPFKFSYAILKNTNNIKDAIRPFEETRLNIINSDMSEEEKNKEILSILEEECEVEIHKVDMSLIEQTADSVGLTIKDIECLQFMINEESEVEI